MGVFGKSSTKLTVLAKTSFDPFSSRNSCSGEGLVGSSSRRDAPTSDFQMSTQCKPCSRSSCSIIQVESSIGCPFHLTKYLRYYMFMVFLVTLLSSTLSIFNVPTTGNYYFHVSICSSTPSNTSIASHLYGYKSATLNMGEIPMSVDNSNSYAFVEKFYEDLARSNLLQFYIVILSSWKYFFP